MRCADDPCLFFFSLSLFFSISFLRCLYSCSLPRQLCGIMMRQEDYPPGTVVFAKLKGYPWWPARVEDDRNIPSHVLSAKSTKSKNPVWTVFFFGSKDYGFFGPDAIRPFHRADVERDLNDKKFKTKDLENAIRQALYPSLLEDEKQEDEEHEQKQKKSQMTRNKSKKRVTNGGKRSSKADEDEESEMTTKTKRRPRKAKPPLDSEEANNRKRHKASSVKSEQEDDDDEEEDNHASSVSGYNGDRPSTPESDKTRATSNESNEYQRYYRRMYMLRHKLQRLVYNKRPGQIPKEDYRIISMVLRSVEDSHMTAQLLRDTKVGSVVKSAGQYMYEDDEYNLQHRCRQLMGRWREQFTPHRHHHNEIGENARPSPAPIPCVPPASDTLEAQSAMKENDSAQSIGPPPNMIDKTKDSSMPIGQVPPVATTPTAI